MDYIKSIFRRKTIATKFFHEINLLSHEIAPFATKASVFVLLTQMGLCALASVMRLMLHADGAWLLFGLALNKPWDLVWIHYPNRFSVYLLTVLPTEVTLNGLHLPFNLASQLYGAIFYSIPIFQWIFIILLTRGPQNSLIIWPILQYVFSGVFAFGFPSEMVIAQGFFWIALLILQRRDISLICLSGFALSYAALAFSHEAAMLAALILIVLACYRAWRDWGNAKTVIDRAKVVGPMFFCLVTSLLWLAVRINNAGGGDSNIIYVLDPRKVLNNPTLWIAFVFTVTIITIASAVRTQPRWQLYFVMTCLVFIAPMLSQSWLNFQNGRYEARTLIVFALPLFGAASIMVSGTGSEKLASTRSLLVAKTIQAVVIGILSITIGANLVFLQEWSQAVRGFEKVIGSGNPGEPTIFTPYAGVRSQMTASEAKAIDSMGYQWTWPFLSVDLARGYRPAQIIIEQSQINNICDEGHLILSAASSSVPLDIRRDLVAFSCLNPFPVGLSLEERLKGKIRAFFQR